MSYDNTNTFVLFNNDKGDNPKRPDRSGTLNIDGVEYFIDGWIKEGAKGKFISGTVKRKDKQGSAPPKQQAKAADFADDDWV